MSLIMKETKVAQNILSMDATELANLINIGKITSLEAVKTYIAHLRKINKKINCLVEDRFSEAIEEAKEADEKLTAGKRSGRLFGVPISIKESFNVTNMKTTGGIPSLKDNLSNSDAQIVQYLKNEGAIILGKTNTPVLCFCQETDNKLYGKTNNPWDLLRTAGGSSGGEGALIASGGAAVGIGSDIGGSIRFPAHFNGVIGFKSGDAQVSDDGSFPPIKHCLQQRMLGIGALAKSVRDAKLINEIISNNVPEETELNSFKVVIETRDVKYPLNPQTHSLLLDVKRQLQSSFEINNEKLPYFHESALLWQKIMSINGAKDIAKIGLNGKNESIVKNYLKERLLKTSELHHYFTWSLIGANLFQPNKRQLAEVTKTVQDGQNKVDDYFNNKIVILPVYHSSAPLHGELYSELFSIGKTYLKYMPFVAYANVWGLPALTIPVGEDENNLPIGIQIISKIGNEDAMFKIGEIIEENFRGYKLKDSNEKIKRQK